MRKNSGMTLIEILIAITIGIIMTAAVIFLFIQSKQSYRENEDIAVMQENARFSLQLLSNDLKHAGFFGGILKSDSINIDTSVGTIGTDCGTDWPTELSENISIKLASTYSSSCLSDASSNSGALEIRSVLPDIVDADDIKDNHLYIRSNITTGCIWKAGADGSTASPSSTVLCPIGVGLQDWELASNLYYISTEDSDNPRLCRMQIDQGYDVKTRMEKQCFTDGIERFHIEFGIDTTIDGGDAVIDTYTPTPAKFEEIVSARIYLLVRSARKNAFYTNDKEYKLGSLTVDAVNDNYKRRVYSTTVLLRNIVNLRKF